LPVEVAVQLAASAAPGDEVAITTLLAAAETLATEGQITSHRVKVWIYNSQNATPEIQHLNALARANQIPIATVTETLTPPTDSFEQWQVAQLQELERALHAATGR
jgi:zinc/manganese transport system substrate-binding protein